MSLPLKRFVFEERHLGTPIVLQLVCTEAVPAEILAREAFEECRRIEQRYSRFLEDNALAQLNRRVGKWTEVDEEFFSLLQLGSRLQKSSQGAFNLSVKSILEDWGYDKDYGFTEKKSSSNTEHGFIEFRSSSELAFGEVLIPAPVELGALGKGYAIDRMVNILSSKFALQGFCINAGGDLFVHGEDEKALPWKIVFEHPQDIRMGIGELLINKKSSGPRGLALASSSPSRRHWGKGAERRHHLVDPRTRKPADQMLAVYTQASEALLADAYSTALFVLGFEEARRLLPRLPVEAMLISPKGEIWQSEGFKGSLYGA